MSRQLNEIELGLKVFAENGQTSSFELHQGTTVPGGDAGFIDAAPLGSLYFRTGTSEVYKKIGTANSTADWEQLGNASVVVGNWRPERVSILTDEVQGAGTRDMIASPFSDDELPTLPITEYVIGEYVLTGSGSTAVLLEITNVVGDNVTYALAANPLVGDDAFIVRNYLPDTPGSQEGQAIVVYSADSTSMVKIGDVDWNFADGINMASGYAPVNGTVSSADTVNSAIEKLDGNQIDLITLSGEAQGAVDHGAFPGGNTIPDNSTTRQALAALETGLETGLDGKRDDNRSNGSMAQSVPTVVDSVLVDEVQSCRWEIAAHDVATAGKVKRVHLEALHNGHGAGDATVVKDEILNMIRIGNLNLDVTVSLSGAAGAQVMQLTLESNESAGIVYQLIRTDIAAL